MIPGLPAGMMDGNEEEASKKLKQIVYVTDAMTARELDGDGSCFVSSLSLSFPLLFVARRQFD